MILETGVDMESNDEEPGTDDNRMRKKVKAPRRFNSGERFTKGRNDVLNELKLFQQRNREDLVENEDMNEMEGVHDLESVGFSSPKCGWIT